MHASIIVDWLFGGGYTPDPAMGDARFDAFPEFERGVIDVVEMFGDGGSEISDENGPTLAEVKDSMPALWAEYQARVATENAT